MCVCVFKYTQLLFRGDGVFHPEVSVCLSAAVIVSPQHVRSLRSALKAHPEYF